MTINEINDELNRIVDRLNELADYEMDNGGVYGVTDIEIALDMREDNGNEAPPTPDELQAITEECERNLAMYKRNDDERHELYYRYYELAHTAPHMFDSGRYARSWHEKF